ncbi:MAG TPA: hypothetical protein VFX45_07730 [Solirubrobacterales bacterium]|nr:hypothetical protein [Solirubrobacterales bacterium]
MFSRKRALGAVVSILAAVGLLVAVTAPADEGNLKWTDQHQDVKADDHLAQVFKGFVFFEASGTPLFGCETEVTITTNSPETGKISEFKPLTAKCVGFGSYDCELESHTTNIAEGWAAKNTTTGVQVEPEKAGKSLTVKYVLKGAKCKAPKLELHSVLNKIILTPKIGENTTVDSFKITSTSGGSPTMAGEIEVDVPAKGTLGLK